MEMDIDLQVKYLLKEATAEEQAQVEKWLDENEENKILLAQLRHVWMESKKIEIEDVADTQAAWLRFKERINTTPAHKIKTIPLSNSQRWMKYAAGMMLIIGITYLAYYVAYIAPFASFHSGDIVMEYTLDDGTKVTLNKHSTIKYPKHFNSNERVVTLNGEAFFNVTPNKQKPFIIHANDADIVVVGTSFNIKSSVAATEVTVATGIVKVSNKQQSVVLQPNEKTTVTSSTSELYKEKSDDELYNYYRTNKFICNNTPLSKLIPVLNEAYGTQITIANNQLNDLKLTTTFYNEPIDSILNIIGKTFNITVEKTKDKIILK